MGGQGKDTISVYNIHSTVAGSSIQVYSRWFEYWTSMVTDTLYWFQTRPFLFLVCWSEKGRSSENLRNSRRQSLKMMGSYTRQHFSGPGISGIRTFTSRWAKPTWPRTSKASTRRTQYCINGPRFNDSRIIKNAHVPWWWHNEAQRTPSGGRRQCGRAVAFLRSCSCSSRAPTLSPRGGRLPDQD
jgi:hypothetical protein